MYRWLNSWTRFGEEAKLFLRKKAYETLQKEHSPENTKYEPHDLSYPVHTV